MNVDVNAEGGSQLKKGGILNSKFEFYVILNVVCLSGKKERKAEGIFKFLMNFCLSCLAISIIEIIF